MLFTIRSNFIDSFKIGDSINYNLKILLFLYTQYEQLSVSDKKYIIKPIVIINTSIAEALLYDFIENRLRNYNKTEKILSSILDELMSKKIDKFSHYIDQAKKYDFFELKDTNFYEAMHSLRKKRNRIHIQNSKWCEPRDEIDAFTEREKELSEKVLEKILTTFRNKYPRRKEYHNYVKDFKLPWEQHFTN